MIVFLDVDITMKVGLIIDPRIVAITTFFLITSFILKTKYPNKVGNAIKHVKVNAAIVIKVL